MVIYLDVLLFQNFIVNVFLITVTMQTIKRKSSIFRVITAAFIGSLYVIPMLVPRYQYLAKMPFQIFMALLMIFIAVKEKNLLFIAKSTIIFYFYSFLLCGLAFYSALSENPNITPNTRVINFSSKNIYIGIMIIYTVINRLVIYVKDRRKLDKFVYNIEIYTKEVKTSLKAFLDTGNELREPATNLPVIIIEKEYFDKINLEGYSIYHIPYSVVNGQHGKLIGIKPDSIKITMDDETREEKAIVAFCDKKLSKYNDYNGLLPRGIL
ncbi:sigma-E processing peptidase SpoIIGA [Clostridium tunisiense]|uniref:sigma-E processing peptidase SpoIIGA n=1 Tax=Clostridium tunisiense TaxID=219748 RepID=UPI000313FBF8|nr:sigma-E processing peptidase SpoIIGA [Clostridium tunisiense]